MLTYVGRGYTPAFVQHYDKVAERLSRGEMVTVIDGPDDICEGWIGHPEAHCRLPRLADRDATAASDLPRLLGHPVYPGLTLIPDAAFVARLRKAFAVSDIRLACEDCRWSKFCTEIAAAGYRDVRVSAVR